MSLDDTSRLLIVLAACDWVSTVVIYLAARREREAALTERAVVSAILSTIATMAAVLGGARLGYFALPNGSAVGMLALGLILVSAPQFIWVAGLVLGKFR